MSVFRGNRGTQHEKSHGRRDDERGDTLLEVLFTLLILGACAVAIVTAFSTTLAASAEQRNLVTLNNLVRDGSEEIFAAFQSGTVHFVACATPASYAALVDTLQAPPPGYKEKISSVEYLSNGVYGTTCVPGSITPQLLTFSVTGPVNTGGTNNIVIQDINPTPQPPAKLIFTTSPVSGAASASATLGPITVEEVDAFGNPSISPVTVKLSTNSAGTAEFATTSGGSAVTSVAIPAGSSTATFYYGDTLAGTPTLSASATGLTGATQQETVVGPSLPSITTPNSGAPQSLKKKTTTATFTITGTAFTSNAVVTVSGSVVSVTKVTFNSSTSLTVTVSTTNSTGTFNLTVSDPGIGSATATGAIVVTA